MKTIALISLPMANDQEVDINVHEIAALREHTVVSYSYQQWTEVTLKSGAKFDCFKTKAEVTALIRRALSVGAGSVT